jgi:antitoxin component YwqK of YwqJK toxin-antitoxin module
LKINEYLDEKYGQLYCNGRVDMEISLINGVKNGICKKYFINTNLMVE